MIFKEFRKWLLIRSVEKQQKPYDERDMIETLWKFDQYKKLNELAENMKCKIEKFRSVSSPKV